MEHIKFILAGLFFIATVVTVIILIAMFDLFLYIVAGVVMLIIAWAIGYTILVRY